MWISHLTLMFAAISAVCSGFAMACIQKLQQIQTVGTGYVDDITLCLSIPREQNQSERSVYRHLKRMSQLWEQLLFITGGRLELSKCFWVPITWRWNHGKPRLVTKNNRSKDLFLRESETKDFVLIPRQVGTAVEKGWVYIVPAMVHGVTNLKTGKNIQ